MRPARPSAGAPRRTARGIPVRFLTSLVLALALHAPPVARAQLSVTGKWTAPSLSLDDQGHARTALHMALLRGEDDWQTQPGHYHSYVLWWESRYSVCASPYNFNGALYGWNPPSDPTSPDSAMHAGLTRLTRGDAELDPGFDIFCSGQTFLKDGRMLLIGGASAENSGTPWTSIFQHSVDSNGNTSNSWTSQGQMSVPRWYPTAKQLYNNDVVAYAGLKYARLHTVGGRTSSSNPLWTCARQQLTADGGWDADLLPNLDPVAESLTGQGRPLPREFATAPVYQVNWDTTRAVLFGGRDSLTGAAAFNNEVWWLIHSTTDGTDSLGWCKMTEITGDAPQGLWKHSAVVEGSSGVLWVVGGLDGSGTPNQNVYRGEAGLDASGQLRKWNWLKFLPSQLPNGPGGRFNACAAYDPGLNRMIVYGGSSDPSNAAAVRDSDVYALTLGTTPSWQKLACSGPRPPALSEAGLVAAPGGGDEPAIPGPNASMYLYGGIDTTGTVRGDVWLMYFPHPDSVSWYKLGVDPSSEVPKQRGAVVLRDKDSWTLRVFGGVDAGGAVSDTMWTLDISRSSSNYCESLPRYWVAQPGHAGLVGAAAYADPFEVTAPTLERITPPGAGAASWTTVTHATRAQVFYPLLFTLPNDDLFDVTATLNGRPTFVYDFSTDTGWARFPDTTTPANLQDLCGGSAVCRVLPDNTTDILKCGKKDSEGTGINATGLSGRIRVLYDGTTAGWYLSGTMVPRIYHNLVTLPSGKVLVTGGMRWGAQFCDSSNTAFVRRPQIWDPSGSGGWSDSMTLAREPVARGYHSSVLLLPDGLVLTGGGNDVPTGDLSKFDVFVPPYLYDPATNTRATPITVSGVPKKIQYNTPFDITVDGTYAATKVTLIRPGAATHGFNSSQVYAEMSFVPCGCGLRVTPPTNAHYVPPGDYLLFVMKGDVPSLGTWVRLNSDTAYVATTCLDCSGGGSGGGGGGGGEYTPFRTPGQPGSFSLQTAASTTQSPDYVDNTLFAGVADGDTATDRLRLPYGPRLEGDHLRVRLRHFGLGHDEYARVTLVAVDHPSPQTAEVASGDEASGTPYPAASLVHANGRDLLQDLATAGRTEGGVGEVFYADLGATGEGSGTMWIETSGRVIGEGGVRIEVEQDGAWQEVAVHTPRQGRTREVITGVSGRHVRLEFLGAHHLYGLGWFDTRQVTETRQELAPEAITHSRDGALAGDATFSLANGDTAWVDFPLLADAPTGSGRDWFLEVEGRPVGYQPSAARLAARHAPGGEAAPPSPPAVMRFLGALPNPTHGGVRLGFELPVKSEVRLEVFDVQGRRVRRFDQPYPAGLHFLDWDRRDASGVRLAPGVYRVRFTAAGRSQTKAVVLLP